MSSKFESLVINTRGGYSAGDIERLYNLVNSDSGLSYKELSQSMTKLGVKMTPPTVSLYIGKFKSAGFYVLDRNVERANYSKRQTDFCDMLGGIVWGKFPMPSKSELSKISLGF